MNVGLSDSGVGHSKDVEDEAGGHTLSQLFGDHHARILTPIKVLPSGPPLQRIQHFLFINPILLLLFVLCTK